MDVDIDSMTDDQLDKAMKVLKKNVDLYYEMINRKHDRERDKYSKEQEEKYDKLINSTKGKKLAEKYKKIVQSIHDSVGNHSITIPLEITFSFSSKFRPVFSEFDDYDDMFERSKVQASLRGGLNKKQKSVLETGLKEVVSQACGDIYGLFPDVVIQEKLSNEYCNIIEEIEEYGLDRADFE